MRQSFDQVATNSTQILESPLTVPMGAEPVFTVEIAGSGTIDDTPTMKLYKGTKDISGTNLTGVMSVSGRFITCKKIVSLTPGEFVFYIYFVDGGIATARSCRFSVPKEGV